MDVDNCMVSHRILMRNLIKVPLHQILIKKAMNTNLELLGDTSPAMTPNNVRFLSVYQGTKCQFL